VVIMGEKLRCWRCGNELALSPPFGRLEECPSCLAQLHVCRMCVNYAPRLPTGCAEQDAEEVRVKDRANFCDWYRPSARAFTGTESAAERQAREQLAALFGEASGPGGEAADRPGPESAADALFRKRDN
jgi:hypothetical protein